MVAPFDEWAAQHRWWRGFVVAENWMMDAFRYGGSAAHSEAKAPVALGYRQSVWPAFGKHVTKAALPATDMACVTGRVPCLAMPFHFIRPAHPGTLLVFSTLFDDYGVSRHRAHAYEPESYLPLPDLYAICIIDALQPAEKMVGGMVAKTNIGVDAPGFHLG